MLNLDIWGEDVEDSPLVFEIGDPDGVLRPTERGYVPMPWLPTPAGLAAALDVSPRTAAPFDGDPRQRAAAACSNRYKARGLTPGGRDRDGVLPGRRQRRGDPAAESPALRQTPAGCRHPVAARARRLRQLSSTTSTTPATRWTFRPRPRFPKSVSASSRSTSSMCPTR